MSTASAVEVAFERWKHGWELTIDGEDEVSTQVATLSGARQQVRDYLDTIDPDIDHSQWTVTLRPRDRELEDRVTATREATREASAAQERAARESRALVAHLSDAGLTGADIAAVLDISRSRVHQLRKHALSS